MEAFSRSWSAFVVVALVLAFAPDRAAAQVTNGSFLMKVASVASVEGACRLDPRFPPFAVTEEFRVPKDVCSASFVVGDVIRLSRTRFGPFTEFKVADLSPGFVVLSAKVRLSSAGYEIVPGACSTYAGSVCNACPERSPAKFGRPCNQADWSRCPDISGVCLPPGTTIRDLVGMTVGGHRWRAFPPDPDRPIFQAFEWTSVHGTWAGPWPVTRSLRVRGALIAEGSAPQFQPAAGAPLPAAARVPLGATVTFQAIDNNGVPVPATFALGASQLQPNVDANALFRGQVLYKYSATTLDQALFLAVHLGKVDLTVTAPIDGSLASGTISVMVERPASLGDDASQLAKDVIDVAHRTGVPPQYVMGHVDKESRGNRFAYRYEPIGPDYGDLFWASRGKNARVSDPAAFFRLATGPEGKNKEVLPQGAFLRAADWVPRASLRIGCDGHGNGGTEIGPGAPVTNPTDKVNNPTAWEIFRCNDKTFPWRMRWSDAVQDVTEATRRAELLEKDPFTAQTTIAASYGLLQVMYARALEEGWQAGDGSRNPSLLFDPPGAAARGEGSLVVGALIVRAGILERAKKDRVPFPPASPEQLLPRFLRAWSRYNGEKGYAEDIASRTTRFLPQPSSPVIGS